MADFNSHFGVLSKALDLRAQRHQILASNIANADTPNYKARDFDFQKAMNNALAGRNEVDGLRLETTTAGHIGGGNVGAPAQLQFRKESQGAVDGNTVDMDHERSEITDNALQYQILTQLISNKFQGLKTAMSNTQG